MTRNKSNNDADRRVAFKTAFASTISFKLARLFQKLLWIWRGAVYVLPSARDTRRWYIGGAKLFLIGLGMVLTVGAFHIASGTLFNLPVGETSAVWSLGVEIQELWLASSKALLAAGLIYWIKGLSTTDEIAEAVELIEEKAQGDRQ